MKRKLKVTIWTIVVVAIISVSILGGGILKGILYDLFNPPFEETVIFPDDSRRNPADTTFTVNGVEIKMIGIKGGKINCKRLRKTIELNDFYIGETEVTQELWMAVMGENPSVHTDTLLCPAENVNLLECLDFVHRLDSISGVDFYIQTYPQWLYAAYMGNRNAGKPYNGGETLDSVCWYKANSDNATHPVKQKKPNLCGIYDMTGNVSEWTMSGSDPLFIAAGGSYDSDDENCRLDYHEYNHAEIKTGGLGLRLVYLPKDKN